MDPPLRARTGDGEFRRGRPQLHAQLRREFTHDLRRIETDLADRTREIRERVEGTIANQGRVWLTLVRQLSQMTEERRASEEARAPSLLARPRNAPPPEDLDRELDSLSELTRSGTPGDDPPETTPTTPTPSPAFAAVPAS